MNLKAPILLITVLLLSFPVHAVSDFEKWKMQQQQGIQQEKKQFQEYKDKRDKEFTAFLKSQWKEVELLKGFKRDKKPKPVKMPVAKPKPAPAVSNFSIRNLPISANTPSCARVSGVSSRHPPFTKT